MGEEPQDQSLVGESACLHREAGKSRAKLVWALLSCSQQCSQPLHLRTAALMQCISALCSLHSGSCVNPPALHFLRCSKTPFTLALRISAWFVSLSFQFPVFLPFLRTVPSAPCQMFSHFFQYFSNSWVLVFLLLWGEENNQANYLLLEHLNSFERETQIYVVVR